MEWNLFTYEQILSQPKPKPKQYTCEEYREYITNHFDPAYCNQTFYNIVMSGFYHDFESTVTPQEQLEWFKKQYNNFTFHYQNEELTIFSLKHEYDNHPVEYSVFIYIHGDYIVELPRVKDLFNEEQCFPACAIWFYNADGTRNDNYLKLSEEETKQWHDFVETGNEIIKPKESNNFSYSEWWRDRREYYFFCKMKIHRFAKYGRVFDKHTYDTFADYHFTLKEMIYYLTEKE